jgi:hypothetical protein
VPQPFKITLKHQATGEVERIEGEFSDSEWSQLSAYLVCSNRLSKCRLRQSQAALRLSISWKEGQQVVHEVTLPPEDDMAAFLHLMRPFVLEREPTNFYKVKNVLARRITLGRFQRFLDAVKSRYAGNTLSFTIQVAALTLTTPEAIDKWLNAFEYHLDEDKQIELRAMFETFPEQSARALFLTAMLERAVAVGRLAQVVHSLTVRDRQERTFTP